MFTRFNDTRDWFFEKRFGLFIHWGLYSINGRHEQEQLRFNVPGDQIRGMSQSFSPRRFNPDEWLDIAAETGMEYLVFTAKHHDGFCLWNTQLTDFNVMQTPLGRDVVGELAAACQKRDFPLEIYYSVVDWHHRAYPNTGRHHEIETDVEQHDWDAYMEYLRGHITELCSQYGKIHGIWWDMNVPGFEDRSVNESIRKLQPSAVINNRGFDGGDYSVSEREFDPEGANADDLAFHRPTEACQSVGANSWGYRKDEDYHSSTYFMRKIAETLARGGNYLMNVGPDADGCIPPEAHSILKNVGSWYQRVKEALVASPAPGLVDDSQVLTTKRGSTIYVICLDTLDSTRLSLRPLNQTPASVTLLNTGDELSSTLEPLMYDGHLGPALSIRGIPVDQLVDAILVFRIEF